MNRMVKAAGLTAAALVLAWFAVRASLVAAFPPAAGIAEAVDPGAPRAVFDAANREFTSSKGRLSSETSERVAAAMRRDPLASEPFLLAGQQELLGPNLERAERLLAEARLRDPRIQLTRFSLLNLYLASNRIAEASTEMSVLIVLLPQTADLLVPQLALLASNPRTRRGLVDAIGDDHLMGLVLDYLARTGTEPDRLLELAARQPALPQGQYAPWQTRLVKRLVEAGQAERAYDLWRRFTRPVDQGPALVYDSRFEGWHGSIPFNWDFVSNPVGSAERVPGPALEVSYFGRSSGWLARQLLLLRPGRYRLSTQVEGSAKGDGSRLTWRILCRANSAVLTSIPLTGVSAQPKTLSAELTVPGGGCESQWLQLMGDVGEFPETQSVRISSIDLARAGGSGR